MFSYIQMHPPRSTQHLFFKGGNTYTCRGRGLACQQQKSRIPIGFYLNSAHPLWDNRWIVRNTAFSKICCVIECPMHGKTNPPGLKHLFFKGCYYANFIYNIRHEMHWQDPILVNNKMKGCRDIKYNTIQKFNNTK